MRRLPPRKARFLRPSFQGFEAIGPASVLIPLLPATALAGLASTVEVTPPGPPFASQADQIEGDGSALARVAMSPTRAVAASSMASPIATPALPSAASPAPSGFAHIVSTSTGQAITLSTPGSAPTSSSGGASPYYSGGSASAAQPASASPSGAAATSGSPSGSSSGSSSGATPLFDSTSTDGAAAPDAAGGTSPGDGGASPTQPTGGTGTGPTGGPPTGGGTWYHLQVDVIDPVPVDVDPAIPGSGVLQGTFNIERDLDDNGNMQNSDWSYDVGVYYRISGGGDASPAEGVDYTIIDPSSGGAPQRSPLAGWYETDIQPDTASQSIEIDVLQDPGRSGPESLELWAYSEAIGYEGPYGVPNETEGIMTLPATTIVSVVPGTSETAEGGSIPGSYVVSLGQPLNYDLTVPVEVSGTAISGVDYQAIGTVEDPNATPPVYDASVTIPAGQTQATISVNPLDDAAQLGDRTLTAAVGGGSSLFIPGVSRSATVTLHDDGKPEVTIVADRPEAMEGDGSTGDLTVTRTGSTDQPLMVDYDVSGSAEAGVDYSALSGVVVIAAGSIGATIPVVPLGQPSTQGDRTVSVNLTTDDSTYDLGSDSSATVTIHDGNPIVSIVATEPDASEADMTQGEFDVSRTGSTVDALTVEYDVSGSAVPGVDYEALTGTVVIPAGASDATIDVVPTGDTSSQTGDGDVIVTLDSDPDYDLNDSNTATVSFSAAGTYPYFRDGSFEYPVIGSDNAQGYLDDPTGTAWTFGPDTGIAANGSEITAGNPPAPDGNQVAYLTGPGVISQIVDFTPGEYQISFSAAQQLNDFPQFGIQSGYQSGEQGNYFYNMLSNQQDFQVLVDGVEVGTYVPTDTGYASYATESFYASGQTPIQFVGLDHSVTSVYAGEGHECTALIDNVSFQDAIGQTDQFTIPSTTDFPRRIVADADGDIWFTATSNIYHVLADQIGCLDPSTGKVTEDVYVAPFDATILDITSGPDGAIWFSLSDDQIGRIDPTTHAVSLYSVPCGGAFDFVNGPGGELWMTNGGDIYSINVQTFSTSVYYTGGDIQSFAIDDTGVVWFVTTDGALAKVDPNTRKAETIYGDPDGGGITSELPGLPNLSTILLSSDGSLWFSTGGQSLDNIDPETDEVETYSPPKMWESTFITLGDDGAIWFTSGTASGTRLSRFDPTNDSVDYFNYDAFDVISGPDHALYYIDCGPYVEDETNVISRVNLEDLQLDDDSHVYVSADDPETELDASVTLGMDSQGDPNNAPDGSKIYWAASGPEATLASGVTTTQDGLSSDTLHTSTHAGDTYQVVASTDPANVATDGLQGDAEAKAETVTVVPGKAANITFTSSVDHLISDGYSTTTITMTARDAEGNLVANDTPVDWDLAGGGRIVSSQPTTLNGKATLVLQAGVMPEDQTITATVNGYQDSTVVTSEAVNISLGLTFGANASTLVTAAVTDADGNPVPSGTPITWFSQKGRIEGQATVGAGGQATASIYLPNDGSVAPGYGVVKAFVGSNVGSANLQYLIDGVQAVAEHRLLAGDGVPLDPTGYAVDQVDGSSVPYDVYSGTTVTITGARPGAKVAISVPTNGDAAGLLTVTGDNDIPGSTATVTIKADGTATYIVTSTGGLPSDRMIEIPITMTYDLPWWLEWFSNSPPPIATVNIALQPGQVIANTLDYVGKLGWAVLAGPGDSVDQIAADMAFSFIPVIGVYSDVRDAVSELSKLWPGGEDPDWAAFGFAAAGIISEILPPADWAVDALKGLYKAANAGIISKSGVLFMSSLEKMKSIGSELVSGGQDALKKLDDLLDSWSKMLPPPFGKSNVLIGPEGIPFGKFTDEAIQNPDELRGLQAWMKAVDDFPQEMAAISSKYGEAVATNVDQLVSKLDDASIKLLGESGKLDIIAEGVAKAGWDEGTIAEYKNALVSLAKNPNVISSFDEIVGIPGSAIMAKKLAADSKLYPVNPTAALDNLKGVTNQIAFMKSQGLENVSEMYVRYVPQGEGFVKSQFTRAGGGDLDTIVDGVAFEVKSSWSTFGSGTEFFNKLLDDAKASKALGFNGVGVAYPAANGPLKKTLANAIEKVEKDLKITVIIKTY